MITFTVLIYCGSFSIQVKCSHLCLEKFLKMSQRVTNRFQEYQMQQNEGLLAAQSKLTRWWCKIKKRSLERRNYESEDNLPDVGSKKNSGNDWWTLIQSGSNFIHQRFVCWTGELASRLKFSLQLSG